MKGRKAIPDGLKLLKGTLQNCRVNKEAPRPADDMPKAPSWLPAGALEFFGRYAARLEQIGIASSTHTEALGHLSLAAYQVAKHAETLENEGYYIEKTTKSGRNVCHHPAAIQLSDAQRRVMALTAEFGLTPASQGKVTVPKKGKGDSPYAEFGNG